MRHDSGVRIKRILVTGTQLVPDTVLDEIRRRGYEVIHRRQDTFTDVELVDALDGVAGYLIGGYEQVRADHLARADRLEALAFVGTDFKANVPGWNEAFRRGIAVINAAGANASSAAEFTMLLALTMTRPFIESVARPGGVALSQPGQGRDLCGQLLGIIGLGRVGGRVARLARLGFGMQVLYTAPRRNPATEHALGITHVPKPELLSRADIVSLHRPGLASDEAPELGAAEFALMRPGTMVLNVGHHSLIEPAALLDAIQSRNLRAAIDGMWDSQNRSAAWDELVGLGPSRFLAVPQMAFNTEDSNRRAGMTAARAVCDVLDGGTSPDVNNPDFLEVRHRQTEGHIDATWRSYDAS